MDILGTTDKYRALVFYRLSDNEVQVRSDAYEIGIIRRILFRGKKVWALDSRTIEKLNRDEELIKEN